MRALRYDLKFTTPAFLAGADQNMPEIRPASLRGAVRWWFRVLGGTPEAEKALFGGVHNGAVASRVALRVERPEIRNNAESLPYSPNTDTGYLIYFAKVSGNDSGVTRTAARHYIGVGSSFTLVLRERRPIDDASWALLRRATEALVRIGSVGLRATRGFGMLASAQLPTEEAFRGWIRASELAACGVRLFRLQGPDRTTWREALGDLGHALRELRRTEDASGMRLSPRNTKAGAFGFCAPRQASALRLCPVATADHGIVPMLLYTDNACNEPSLLDVVERAVGISPLN